MTKLPHCDNCTFCGNCNYETHIRAANVRPRCHHHEFKPKKIEIRRNQKGQWYSPHSQQMELAL
jgi:DNA polymerase III delta prime subunit